MLLIKFYNLLIAAIKDAEERVIITDFKKEWKAIFLASSPSLYTAGPISNTLV
jgi:hypothetical protein